MPNLPLKVGKGMSCICKGRFANNNDLFLTQSVFDKMGKTLVIDEAMMNAVTAVSGSGPGFFYHLVEGKKNEDINLFNQEIFIPQLTAAAKKLGFTAEQALLLAQTTGEGSIAVLEYTRSLPAQLKIQVASKGGTTEAGLAVLMSGGTLEQAVIAAKKRADEITK
jgi:pyrroline-5-carboxylate reductase